MKHFIEHLRTFIFRGLLAVIPLLLCTLAVQLLYNLIDKRVLEFLSKYFEVRKVPGLGILLVLVSLYFIGLVVSNIIGHQVFRLLELFSQRIPFIKTIYNVGKQLSQGLSLADGEKQAFKKAILVRINTGGPFVLAFVMNSAKGRNDEEFFFVLVPTSPTPGSGFVCVVKASETVDPGWTVEECLKTIISAGIITPKDKNLDL